MIVADKVFRFTHISDPHLTSLDAVRLTELLNKRLLGYLSWHWRRKKRHLPKVLSVVAERARLDGEHLVITGDLTQIGLADECRQAREWLEALGQADQISVIPGNHDVYASRDASIGLWQPWMQSDPDRLTGLDTDAQFPFVRKRECVAFLGISSAVVTPPFFASGKIDSAQLARLELLLKETKGCFRVLLVHHSPAKNKDSFRRRLSDAAKIKALLAKHGVELILHGHNHTTKWCSVPGPSGDIPVIGVASASAAIPPATAKTASSSGRAGYHAYEVVCRDGRWQLQVFCYRLESAGTTLVLDDQRCYLLPI